MRLNIQGNAWRVVLATSDDDNDLDAEGVCSPDHLLMGIDRNIDPSRAETAFMHELLHAMMSATASKNVLARIFDCEPDDTDEREEALVSFLAPILHDTLTRNGMLTLPKRPR